MVKDCEECVRFTKAQRQRHLNHQLCLNLVTALEQHELWLYIENRVLYRVILNAENYKRIAAPVKQ